MVSDAQAIQEVGAAEETEGLGRSAPTSAPLQASISVPGLC